MRVSATREIDSVGLRVEEILPGGERIISLTDDVDLYAHGSMPLPPYIQRESDSTDTERYQTVFAETPGALAAPTAGLHFTPEILSEMPHTFITLHVGPGTFRPVHSEDVTQHRMHAESFSISEAAAEKINNARRIVAVGTTTVRVLEAVAHEARMLRGFNIPRYTSKLECNKHSDASEAKVMAQKGETSLFIYSPFEFRMVDALLTNFHLPRSTLLMLVSAFAGREFVLRAYAEAIRERYRFYSYGDCMLLL
jgi:S-adenosylmethionine:tRNA ribosyltransferase-isomerase